MNYAYIRCNLCVRVVLTSSQFNYGKILVSYQPLAYYNLGLLSVVAVDSTVSSEASRNGVLNYLSQSPFKEYIDVKSSNPVVLELPYIAQKPIMRTHSGAILASGSDILDMSDMGVLYIYSMGEVNTTATTTDDLEMQIYAWAEDVHLGCPTACGMEVKLESDERKVGPVEKLATSLATWSSYVSVVPEIGPLAMASTMLFKGIAGVASWFGWSKPAILQEVKFVKNQPFMNSSACIGMESTQKLTFDPKQELTSDPRVVARSEDEMVIQHIAAKESLLTHFDWRVVDTPLHSNLFSSLVTPMLATKIDTTTHVIYQPTACAFAATPFNYWRGTMRFRFEVICSSFHRGKLLIFFDPYPWAKTRATAHFGMNQNYMAILDLQETQCVSLDVEWAFPRAWCRNLSNSGVFYGPAMDETQVDFHNGIIGVVPFTTLTGPSASAVRVNVYVSCADLLVQGPNEARLPTDRNVAVLESDETVMSINNPVSEVGGISQLHFGEQLLSFRTLLKRFITHRILTLATETSGSPGMAVMFEPLYPAPYPRLGQATDAARIVTLLAYLSTAYIGVRGGTRRRVSFVPYNNASHSESATSKLTVSMRDLATVASTSIGWSTSNFVKNSLRGSISFVPHTNGGIEFEIPHYDSNLFRIAFGEYGYATLSQQIPAYNAGYEINMHLDLGEWRAVIDSAIADDFSLMGFQAGAPYRVAV